MEFLYQDGDDYYFMNTENYEQTHLSETRWATAVEYLTPNLQIKVEFYDGKAVGIELPQTVDIDRGGNGAGIEVRHCIERDQAGED